MLGGLEGVKALRDDDRQRRADQQPGPQRACHRQLALRDLRAKQELPNDVSPA